MPRTSGASHCTPRSSGAWRSTPRCAPVSRAWPRHLAYARERRPGNERGADEGSRACRDHRRHRVPAGSDMGTLCPSAHYGRVSRRARPRREVPRRCRRDRRSFRRADRRSAHRSCVAHPGEPVWSATTPGAVDSLARGDGPAVAHHSLSIRPARAARWLLRARPLVAGMWRSGKAAHGGSRGVRPHEGSRALVHVRAADCGVSDRAVCG